LSETFRNLRANNPKDARPRVVIMRSPAASVSRLPGTSTTSAAPLGIDWAPFRLWLAVRDSRPRPVRFPGEVRRIMVGADFSPASDAAMGVVFGIAATTGTVVDLVHVLDGFTEAFVHGDRPLLDHVDAILARVAGALRARMTAAASEGVRCVSTSLAGAPGIELTRHARRTGADLLVLGVGRETSGPLGRAWSAEAAVQVLRTGSWHQRPLVSAARF
jgi:nucleotide-binding universal stress UspA family protein